MANKIDITILPIQHNKDGITIKLTPEMARYLGISRKVGEVFIIPTDKTLQISVGEPVTAIPALVSTNDFLPDTI